jgi:hypothetical protein
MAGLLDYITEAAKAQYAKGAPYRNALGGLLSGDMSALQELNKPSPVMPNEALDVAMTFAPMGTLIGNSSSLWNSQAARAAAKLEKQGIAPERIWELTAEKFNAPTGRSPDKILKQEISDYWDSPIPVDVNKISSVYDVMPQNLGYHQMNKIFVEPATENAYIFPSIKMSDYKRTLEPSGKYVNQENRVYKTAQAMSDKGTLNNANELRASNLIDKINLRAIGNPENYTESLLYSKPTLLHERQHAIQDIEGFARGGTPKEFQDFVGAFAKKEKRYDDLISKKKLNNSEKNELMTLTVMRNKAEKEYTNPNYLNPSQKYFNLAGEAEARLVERRAKLTEKELAKNYPFKYDPNNQGQFNLGYDVPLDKLIFK